MTTAEKLYLEALEADKLQQHEKSFTLYSGSAELGLPAAQCNLGVSYLRGRGTQRNDQMAFYWFQKAADQDHAIALANLAFCYRNGRGVSADPYRALALYRKAADQGYKAASDSYTELLEELRSTSSGKAAPADPKPDFSSFFTQSAPKKAPAQNPQAMAEAEKIIREYKPSGFPRFCSRLLGVFIVGCITLLVQEGISEESLAGCLVFVLFGAIIIWLRQTHYFRHRRRYYRKTNIESLIRNDSGNMPVSIKVYNSLPGKRMLAYIKGLNPEAAEKIARELASRKA